MAGQVVDTESAQEFMREALGRISEGELNTIADELEIKSQKFQRLLAKETLGGLDESTIRALLRSVFATRRKADELLRAHGAGGLMAAIRELLYGPAPLIRRFQTFHDSLETSHEYIRFDLPGELLHYGDPEDYWLWTRWMWDPKTKTGALPLVTMEGYSVQMPTAGETYLRVGEAVSFVRATGEAAGFARIGRGPFGIDVYLACVYAVYVFTTLRLRMTEEFNRVIPPLPELCRRLLGVHRMEI